MTLELQLTGELLIRTSDGERHVCRSRDELNKTMAELVMNGKEITALSMSGSANNSFEKTATMFFGPNKALMETGSRVIQDLQETHARSSEDDFNETMILNERWADILERIQRANEDTALWATGITHSQVENGTIVLFFRSTHHLNLVMTSPHADIICGAIRVSTGLTHNVTARFQGGV